MKLVALLRLVNPNSFALIDSEIFIHVTLLEFFHCLILVLHVVPHLTYSGYYIFLSNM